MLTSARAYRQIPFSSFLSTPLYASCVHAKQRLQKDFIPQAKDVVWPLLDEELWVEPELESMQQAVPPAQVRLVLDSKLSDTLQLFL